MNSLQLNLLLVVFFIPQPVGPTRTSYNFTSCCGVLHTSPSQTTMNSLQLHLLSVFSIQQPVRSIWTLQLYSLFVAFSIPQPVRPIWTLYNFTRCLWHSPYHSQSDRYGPSTTLPVVCGIFHTTTSQTYMDTSTLPVVCGILHTTTSQTYMDPLQLHPLVAALSKL